VLSFLNTGYNRYLYSILIVLSFVSGIQLGINNQSNYIFCLFLLSIVYILSILFIVIGKKIIKKQPHYYICKIPIRLVLELNIGFTICSLFLNKFEDFKYKEIIKSFIFQFIFFLIIFLITDLIIFIYYKIINLVKKDNNISVINNDTRNNKIINSKIGIIDLGNGVLGILYFLYSFFILGLCIFGFEKYFNITIKWYLFPFFYFIYSIIPFNKLILPIFGIIGAYKYLNWNLWFSILLVVPTLLLSIFFFFMTTIKTIMDKIKK
jgi:hypothetical protein